MRFNRVQNEIYAFIEKVKPYLGDEHAIYYGGQFVTGQIHYPDILFMGINPGYGKDWEKRPKSAEHRLFEEIPCKYIEEAEDKLPLATKVVDILLDGDASRLTRCAETSLKSFFATPNEAVLNKMLNLLPSNLRAEHDNLIKYVIGHIRPQQIVCIGLTVFHEYLKQFGSGGYEAPIMKSLPSSTGKSDPVYYKYTVVQGIPVHGILHLSGARLSAASLEALRIEFQNIYTLVNQNNIVRNPYNEAQQPNDSKYYLEFFHYVDYDARKHTITQQDYMHALELGRTALKNAIDNNESGRMIRQAIQEAISSSFPIIAMNN